MEFNRLIPELIVENLERSLDFYINDLAFVLEYERPKDGFAFVSLDRAQIMLQQRNGHWETDELIAPLGRGINFQITVTDVNSLYLRLKSKGHKFYGNLKSETYEVNGIEMTQKEFLIQDPDGYLLRFCS